MSATANTSPLTPNRKERRLSKPLKNDLLLRAARRERTERTPVWMMRQAGRFDPEYCAVRDRANLPLEIAFSTPDLAAEISLLPKRFGVDAIIYYQDILTPLTPMGTPFVFRPGPILADPIRTANDVAKLTPYDPTEKLPFIQKELNLVRNELDGDLPLLGFAGAPVTLAFFMIEGKSPGRDPQHSRQLMADDPKLMHDLLTKLAEITAQYLAYQIESGADAIQLFESVGDLLTKEEYTTFAHPYHTMVFEKLAAKVPTILFVKEQPFVELMAETGADVLSVGSCVDIADAKRRVGKRVALQGNIDNQMLVTGGFERIDAAVEACVRAGRHEGHILNLNHGLLKETPFENGCRVVETCKRIRLRTAGTQVQTR